MRSSALDGAGDLNNIVSGASVVRRNANGSERSAVVEPVSSPRPLVVAVDVDEVLGRFLESLNVYVNIADEFPDRRFTVKDYHVYEFAKVWDCSADESNRIVHEFFNTRHFADIAPIPGALESLRRIKSSLGVSLNVVTSRQHVIQEPTMDWLGQHFEGVFDDVFFGNHFSLSGTSKKKSEMCQEIGAGILVDDNLSYAMECAEAGIEVLLFDWDGGYPWSNQRCAAAEADAHPLVTRVRGWEEVEAVLGARVGKVEVRTNEMNVY